MSKVVLECCNLYKRISGKELVSDVSFSLKEGEIMGLIGPNGAGKTTTIKLILGLYKLNSGSIKICGYDISRDYVKAIGNVGAIIESPDMYMYMSGYDNLMITSKIYNISKDRVMEVINLVNLGKRIYDKVSKYSLGMRQRLGIAQAILHNPKLLILDEPTNGLDPEGIVELKRLLKKLASKGIGIIVSSHILSELESFCSNVCIINKGRVINCGSINKLINLSSNNYIIELSEINISKCISNYNIIDNTHIRVKTNSLNDVIRKLLNNNINIYEIKREVLSLEDIFMSLVGGNTID
ncbi:MAG: ABC transporter ATP-binding protein [Bacilli bacterium]|nr:ABC transporter ATP-binding protein [Bacilli bacterium]